MQQPLACADKGLVAVKLMPWLWHSSLLAAGLSNQCACYVLLLVLLCRIKERWLRKASSLKRRVALDFSLDETAAAKLTLGLGDSHTPGFSLFTMPMVDIREMPHQVSLRCADVS